MDPAVLVLDEPTTGQDADGVARVGAVVGAMRAAGRTVVAITHDMEFAADDVSLGSWSCATGVVVADGPPGDGLRAGNGRPARLDRPDAAAGGADRGARLGLGTRPARRRAWPPRRPQRSRLTQTPPGPV